MPDIWSPEKRSEVMSRIRGVDTGPELALRHCLHAMGYRYRLHPSGVPGRPDVVFPRDRLVVFVHGCFWHGCPKHYSPPRSRARFWRRKLLENRRRDARVRRELKRSGWSLIEFWEHEVESDPARRAQEVTVALARLRRALSGSRVQGTRRGGVGRHSRFE